VTHRCFEFGPDDPLVADLGPAGAAAIAYARNGYAVLPLAPGRKPPHRMLGEVGGVHLATTDARVISAWWRSDRTANVGVACGSVSRLVVFDLDVKHGDGPAEFREHLGAYIPDDAKVATPSGGLHIWLRTPAGLAVRGKQGLYPNVDVKADGGYVVAAPSIGSVTSAGHGDKGASVDLPYRWVSGCPCSLPALPDAEQLAAWIGAQPGRADRLGLEGAEPIDLDELVADGMASGSRNVTLYRVLCSLYRKYGTGPDAEPVIDYYLERILARTDRTDFGDREVAAIRSYARSFAAAQEEAGRPMMASWLKWRKRWER
jgi:hypothetical protein